MQVRAAELPESKRGGISIAEAKECIEKLSRFEIDEFDPKELRESFGMGFFLIADVNGMHTLYDPEAVSEKENKFTDEAKQSLNAEGKEYNPERTKSIMVMTTELMSPILAPYALKKVQAVIRALLLGGHAKIMKAVFESIDLPNCKIEV